MRKPPLWGGSLVTWWLVLFFCTIIAGILFAHIFIVLGVIPQVPTAST